MKKRIGGRSGKAGAVLLMASVFLLGYAVILSMLYEDALPEIKNTAKLKTETMISDIVSEVAASFGDADVSDYRFDSDGRITGVISDTGRLNDLRRQVIHELSVRFEKSKVKIKIPVGTLSDSILLSGFGPPITVYIDGYSGIAADYVFENEAIGLNTGCCIVSLKVKIKTRMLFPKGKTEDVKMTVSIPVERIVIAGNFGR